MIADLHTHTTASDGALAPHDLLQRASQQGVELLSITDHDTLDGYQALDLDDWAVQGLRLIHGIELSTVWRHTGVHVLGLNVDSGCPVLRDGVARHQQARVLRLQTILERLAKAGLPVSLARVRELAGDSQPGRPHVARHLLELGLIRDEASAFDKYLGAGKVGDVKHLWCALDEVVGWIVAAGGVAVLAHPAHYRLTRTKLLEMLDDFKAAGGRGMEVVSGHQDPDTTHQLLRICNEQHLLASCGSDFHRPERSREIGAVRLPAGCEPVWARW